MVSSFYSSNEQKEKAYVESQKKKEVNDYKQQEIVDDEIAKELGLQQEANNLSKLATRVVNKIGTELIPKQYNQNFTKLQYTPMQLLTNSIQTGQLTSLFDKIKALPNSSLNKKQKLIRGDLSDSEFKSIMNDSIAESSSKGVDAIANTVVETMGGDDAAMKSLVLDMIEKAMSDGEAKPKRISEAGFSEKLGREKKKVGRPKKKVGRPKKNTN